MSSDDTQTRCGFVAVVGLPNAGKSTLINHLVGSKVSIVSHKVHTTRMRILGIALHKGAQIILVDTPGIYDASKKGTLERAMVGAAYEALDDADAVLHIVDAAPKHLGEQNKALVEKLPKNKPSVLALNKIDKTSQENLLKHAQGLNDHHPYDATFMISSLKGHGTEKVLDHFAQNLPEGPWVYEEDQITDLPMRMMAAEITREKIFNQLHKELPYATFVQTESWEQFDNGSIKINQVVYVERDTQKAIVLGKGGSRIKQIGQEARLELEEIFDARIHLKLFVKVQDGWAEKPENLREIGLAE